MIKILEGLTLPFQCIHNCDEMLVTRACEILNLLNSNNLSSSGIQRLVDETGIAHPDLRTPNPFEDGCKGVV